MLNSETVHITNGKGELTIPLGLIDKDTYPDMRMSSVIWFAFLRNRPIKIDSEGQEYREFPLEDAMELLGWTQSTISKGIKQLKDEGIIKSEQPGYGRKRRYYIIKFK